MFGNCVSCFCCLWCRRSKTWIYGSRFLDDWRHDGAFPGWRTFNICSRRRKLYCKPFSRGKEANQRYSDGYDHFHPLCSCYLWYRSCCCSRRSSCRAGSRRESVNCSKRDPFGPCLRILYVLRCWICADFYLKLPVCLGAKAYHAGL